MAKLAGLSLLERIKAIISVPHAVFQEELAK